MSQSGLIRLSLPIDHLQAHYDAVVVGSGYGGGVAASRLARMRRSDGSALSVCVLERGAELQPGEYPDTVAEAAGHFQWRKGALSGGRPTALYDLRLHEDMHVFLGCGLGGTSLVNANVSLEADPRVFDHPRWPAALRQDESGRKAGYQRARDMLKPQPYPADRPTPAKLQVLQQMADSLPATCTRPPINVNFTVDGPNHVGVVQQPCTGCGDCVSGCNVSAKNTTLMNYLPDARNHGAEIYCEVQVHHLAWDAGQQRWQVYYQLLDTGRDKFGDDLLCLTASQVVLGAGSLGSTEILLRSRQSGLPLSSQLGQHFTGNGDVLAFAYNLEQRVNGIGDGTRSPDLDDPVGPCITGLIDQRGCSQVQEGYVIEEGSLPGAMASLLPAAFAAADATLAESPEDGMLAAARRQLRETESVILGAYHGAVQHTQTFLVMSHDGAGGRLSLDAENRVQVVWPQVGELPVFQRDNAVLRDLSFAEGGEFVRNPMWTALLGKDLITVHPLGGCGMGERAEQGVVNHLGQVFAGEQGDTVHPGLFVLDGAIMPTSLGVNPLFTITALAERSLMVWAAQQGWTLDVSLPSHPAAPLAPPPVGIRFTETMKGYFSTAVKQADAAGFQQGYLQGEAADSPLSFTLTIESNDLAQLLDEPAHMAGLIGTVHAPALCAEPLTTSQGRFQLLTDNAEQVDTRNMRYQMQLHAPDGRSWFFFGEKIIRDDPLFDMWADTTTLYVRVHEGTDAQAQLLGVGILHIQPLDFLKQMQTLQVLHASTVRERLAAMARFGRFFAGKLVDSYLGGLTHYPFGSSEVDETRLRKKRSLRVPPPQLYPVQTDDGVTLRLSRYQGGDKGTVLLGHGLGVASTIFSLDTIDTNLLEYLFAHGYDVWLLDFRASIALPSCRTPFTGDDVARRDWPAAVAQVCALTGQESIHVIGHCFGASTLFMAMAAGMPGVRSALFSQVAGHVKAPFSNRLRAGLHLPEALEVLGVDTLDAFVDKDPGWFSRLYDMALTLNPAIPRDEGCHSAVCHRISFMYALLYEHAQLNELTHETLSEWFGIANIESIAHLARMVREGKVVAADGEDVYLPEDAEALSRVLQHFHKPVSFIHGSENACFLPESTALTYDLLCETFGSSLYQRTVIDGYGHIDCIFGKQAAQDVYPHVLAHLQRSAAG